MREEDFKPKLKITARIQRLERSHSGKWTCIATNSQGRASMSCDVQVMELSEWEARVHQDVLNSQELVKVMYEKNFKMQVDPNRSHPCERDSRVNPNAKQAGDDVGRM